MSFSRPTISELRSVYPETKKKFDKGNLWGFLVLRWTSFYPTWLLIRLGFSPNAVTILSLVAGVAGAALLAIGRNEMDIVGAALINLWNWLDYVDGNIARYKRTETSYGHFMDETVGNVVIVAMGIGSGIGAYNGNSPKFLPFLQEHGIPGLFLVALALLGVWAYTLRFLFRHLRQHFANTFPSSSVSPELTGVERGYQKISSVIDHAVSLLPPLLLYDAIFSGMGAFIVVYAFLFTVSAAISLMQLVIMAKRSLVGNVGRGGDHSGNKVTDPVRSMPEKTNRRIQT